MLTQNQLVIMKSIKCSYESCRKEFKMPIVVTNFSFTPKNEPYYACPYCLTKIESITNGWDCTPVNTEKTVFTENGKPEQKNMQPKNSTTPRSVLDVPNVSQVVTREKLEALEKERAVLLVELDELRNGAMQKIYTLNEEVAALRDEAKILKKLTA